LFVPGGDPGHTDPTILFPFLARVTEVLHRYHPNATVWVSSQGYNAERLKRFYDLVAAKPAWLTGIVAGPQSCDDLIAQRAQIPKEYPIRFYPDIGHTMEDQFPVERWDEAYALTEGREVINPRPLAETIIFRHFAPYMNGFVTYSEGVNDDVNKFIWTALGWSAESDPMKTLREYARYLAGTEGAQTSEFADAIVALEANWNGRLLTNNGVDETLRRFQQLQHVASPEASNNWRFEEALYRAYTDAYVRHRLIDETKQENRALAMLSKADRTGSLQAMTDAEHALAPEAAAVAQLRPWRNTIEELAGRLFKHIGLQLSVTKFGASAVDRGASLDTVDVSLNDRVWLNREFKRIRGMGDEASRRSAIKSIVHWNDPGPGGFYDDLGNPEAEPHLIRGPGLPADPGLRQSAYDGVANHTPDDGWRISQVSCAGSLYDHPLELRYTGLDRSAEYRLRITYAGEDYTNPIQLMANSKFLIHGLRLRAANPDTVEFDVPLAATRDGNLELRWTKPEGMGGGGRGLQVAEVWLIRK
jgi:hypothetical protein